MVRDEIDSFITRATCECSDSDWECDAGYSRTSHSHACLMEKNFDSSQSVPPDCSKTYEKSDGYRKKSTSYCRGGKDHPKTSTDCPSKWSFLSSLFYYIMRVSLE